MWKITLGEEMYHRMFIIFYLKFYTSVAIFDFKHKGKTPLVHYRRPFTHTFCHYLKQLWKQWSVTEHEAWVTGSSLVMCPFRYVSDSLDSVQWPSVPLVRAILNYWRHDCKPAIDDCVLHCHPNVSHSLYHTQREG